MSRLVSTFHADFARRAQQWKRIRDALEGSDNVKEQGEAYLPRPSGMDLEMFKAYLKRAHYFPTTERTLRGLSGLVFRHAAQFELPPRLEPLREVATTDGYSLEVLAEQVTNEVLSVGRYGILLDYPSKNTTANSIPYLATYTAENITDWKVQFIEGMRVLTRVVLRDSFDSDDDDDQQSSEQRLELILNADGNYEMRKWQAAGATATKSDDYGSWILSETMVPTVNGKPLKRIPFVFINPYDLRPDVEKPPMLDLVDVNLSLYRNSADYEHALFLTSQPTPWVAGAVNEEQKPTHIGSGAFWVLPEGTQVGMLEFQGAGIQAMERAMEAKKQEMAALGARMIHEGQNRNESQETAQMRGRSELSLLTNVVNMVEAGLYKILTTACEWIGANTSDLDVKLNRDWIATRMDAQALTALVKAWQSGAMSHQTLYENLQRGEIAPVDRSFEDEKDLIEEEGGDLGMGVNEALLTGARQTPSPQNSGGTASTPSAAEREPEARREDDQ
jgi:hypothetical protein